MSGRLPTFLGIGAVKCGTTSIHRYLSEHPEVFASPMKETNFFGYEGQKERRFRVRSWRSYRRQFAGAQHERVVGEFSPQYMNYPRAAGRIAEALPDARLLVSLRSPADRAYSCWVGSMRTGIERLPAEVALEPGTPYIDRGFYRERLRPYFELFPSEQIKIVIFEEFLEDPAETMREIYRFLGTNYDFAPDVGVRHNSARYPRYPRLNVAWQSARRLQPRGFTAPAQVVRWNRALLEHSYAEPPPFDPVLRSRLLELYREEVARMEALLGRELPMWRR